MVEEIFKKINSKTPKYFFNIFILLLSYFIVKYLYNYFTRKFSYTLFKNKIYLNKYNNKFISSINLPKSKKGIKYSYSFWIYLHNIPNNMLWDKSIEENKNIFNKNGSPHVYYLPKFNIIKIEQTFKNQQSNVLSFSSEIDNLPLQKWNHIVFQLDNRYLHIYLNNKIIKTNFLPNIPLISNSNLYIGSKDLNFLNGYIFNGKYYNYLLNDLEIKNLYYKSLSKLPKIKQI